ncbi:MAG: peroxiredoxin [Chthoniobacteraceae bacterium]|nr:peroxiredoxin [Chthoniobacteraceae bacterium]
MKLKTTLTALFSLVGITFGAHAELEVGKPAPEITAIDQDGKSVDFKDVYAKGPTLVYFFPKADTPGCTKQACSIRDDWSALKAKGIQVLGVSGDKAEGQKKFQEKYTLPFTLIADSDSKVADAFGVGHVLGIDKRQSFLIQNGKIVWTMPKATTSTHAKDVLEAYEKLTAK